MRTSLLISLLLAAGCSRGAAGPTAALPTPAVDQAPAAAPRRPNILLIVADDLGFSDIGVFGGEIHTPNLDRLASEGRLLTDHHAAATCSPTRAMMISGTDHHLVGLGNMAELLAPEQLGKPGYEGYLNARSLSFAQLLGDSGYHTYIAGKWHLGLTEERSPKAWGFERSFVLTAGAGSQFAPVPGRAAEYDKRTYREDGQEVALPSGFFSTDAYTDKLIGYIDAQRADGKPFVALATYTAPHWPLQAPEAFIDRYRGKYDAGYEAVRAARLDKQKRLGLFPRGFEPFTGQKPSADNPAWRDLTEAERKLEARRMEIYAAMVENLDHNVGRLLTYLEQTGQYEDTLIWFQSDNGAEAHGTRFADVGYDNSYENLGRPLSNVAYGKRWAEVSATPFRLWKGTSAEGGIAVPAIVRLPRQHQGRAPYASLTHVTDLAPTFLALAGVADPGSRYKDRDVHPITGVSLLPALLGEATAVRAEADALVDELFGLRYVRRGNWKATFLAPPEGTGRWTLYDLSVDRAELHDVAEAHADVLATLVSDWDAYVQRVGVVLPHKAGSGRR
jgi:arylsulfatase A-like enzyme